MFLAGGFFTSSAQVHLRISSLNRFPVAPTDTAYENQTYDSITVDIQNIGNTILNNDNISVYIVGNPALGVDILYDDTTALYSIQMGSTTVIQIPTYSFHPTHFDDGDNIVVVWPAARQTPFIADSLTFHVYFISLLAGIEHSHSDPISIAPNPMSDYIVLDLPPEKAAKQVRIIDSSGRIFMNLREGRNYISTTNWTSGIYLLQYIDENGKNVSKRLIKN